MEPRGAAARATLLSVSVRVFSHTCLQSLSVRQVPHATTCKAQQHASESRYSKLSFTSYLCNKRAQTRMKLLAALARRLSLSLPSYLSFSLYPSPWPVVCIGTAAIFP